MYIKQIIIQGFKSYKDQTVIEPFSPKHNVIVGRNGSGKSNFFAAIRFVLSDAYTQMNKEERQGLLHEGTGAAVMSAFVEIIFDNSDDRFPTGKPELILRRTIGMKKDEYSLDRKNATKADVMNLLESAGFSRSNPYYIVPQGRVTALTNMKDAERLLLLKEVAGTQVYEARRTESLKIMNETNNKREKIDELLDYIKERLSELESEKDELRQYQERDRDRRCLQYTIDHQEQMAIEKELDSLEEQRQNGKEDTDDRQEQFLQGERELEKLDAELSELKQHMDLLKLDKSQLDDERKELSRKKAQVELEVQSYAEGRSAAQHSKKQRAGELKSVKSLISEREKQLAQLKPRFDNKLQEESVAKSQLDEVEATRQRLYAKQGRGERFKTRKQRDDWLQEEVNNNYSQLAKVKAVRVQTTEDLAALETAIATIETEVNSLREQLEGRGKATDEIQGQIEGAKAERAKQMDERKELRREDDKLQSVLSNEETELRRAEQILSHTMDQNTSKGIAAVRRIQRQHNLHGVFGTIAELCDVNQGFQKAVEATAGASLFHYVVDNDTTATRLIEILNKERAGRLTFIPLNRVHPRTTNVPKANDALPLLEKLSFDQKFERAFEQVFGSTIVCPNLIVAGQYARSHGVNGVTLDGDRSDRKGAFTGGYQEPKHSRLQAMKNVANLRDKCDSQRARSTELQKAMDEKDQEVTRAVGELQKLEQRSRQLENSYGPLRQELRIKTQTLQKMKDDVDSKTRAKSNIEANMKALTDLQAAHEAESKTEFKKALTPAEETQLENLSSTVEDLQRTYSSLASQRSDLESQKSMLEIELTENLRPRVELLQGSDGMTQDGESSSSRDLTNAERELSRTAASLDKMSASLAETEASLETTHQSISSLQIRRSETLATQNEIATTIEKSSKRLEKYHQKRRILQQRAAEVAQTIRDLGILPSGVDKYAKISSEKLVKRLHKVNEELKKYGHVNKKAFEQYNNFTTQRDNLTNRRGELEASATSIQDLITVLDQRKDEAIERTFKQVSREFALVFEKLVPAGRGRLVIQRRTTRDPIADEDDDADEGGQGRGDGGTESYTGVGISVSFNSRHDDQQRIQQLSGGQKSLCALTLIFAIQRCDPAPFYLFDEIDANLDAQYRTAVAQMLHEISDSQQQPSANNGGEGSSAGGNGTGTPGGGQFICTTFRPEMLLVAEKTYGVRYQKNKSSSVVVVSREEALEFVEGEKQ